MVKMKKILITAFEPFGEDNVNPTAEIIRALPDHITLGGQCNESVDKITPDVGNSVSAENIHG